MSNRIKNNSILNWNIGIKEWDDNGVLQIDQIELRGIVELESAFVIIFMYTNENQEDGVMIIPNEHVAGIHYKPTPVIKLNTDEGPEDENDLRA